MRLGGIKGEFADVRLIPISSNFATCLFRVNVDFPPKTVAIILLFSRLAEATRLNPALCVYPVLMPSAPL